MDRQGHSLSNFRTSACEADTEFTSYVACESSNFNLVLWNWLPPPEAGTCFVRHNSIEQSSNHPQFDSKILRPAFDCFCLQDCHGELFNGPIAPVPSTLHSRPPSSSLLFRRLCGAKPGAQEMKSPRHGLTTPSMVLLVIANLLIPIALYIFGTGFFPYKPLLPGLAVYGESEYGPPPAAPFDRVVFMVVDALRRCATCPELTPVEANAHQAC